LIIEKIFSMKDQRNFSKLSGDFNPIHIDEVASKKMIFGGPIVHGLHLVLWAVENLATRIHEPFQLEFLKVIFRNPAMVGEKMRCEIEFKDLNSIIFIKNDYHICVEIKLSWNKNINQSPLKHLPVNYSVVPISLELNDLEKMIGEFKAITNNCNIQNKDFLNNALKYFSNDQFNFLSSLSRLVGMHCPGQQSIFSEILIKNFEPDVVNNFHYKVSGVNKKFNLVEIELFSESLQKIGDLKTFYRPKKIEQSSFKYLKKLVQSNEFLGQNALVIGGSKGLGEITTKLLCAGGAKVMFTYFSDISCAQMIKSDIESAGSEVSFQKLDVENADSCIHSDFTHLYYFATPRIIPGKMNKFNNNLFNRYLKYYVEGFVRIFFMIQGSNLKKVFYPSTIFIDKLDDKFVEYTAAKIAGESVIEHLNCFHQTLKFYKPRLDKFLTDQTNSISQLVLPEAPDQIILNHLRVMHDSQS
jgi:hypothetical protein